MKSKRKYFSIWAIKRAFKKHFLGVPARKYGRIPDDFDPRDFTYRALRSPQDLPVSTERKNINAFQHRYDQGQTSSCCGFGTIEAFRRVLQVNMMPDFPPSAYFSYWTLRRDKNSDSGGQIRDAFKAMNQYGICSEMTWPHIPEKILMTPSPEAFAEALDHQSITYQRIWPVTKGLIMDAINRGFPIVYGKYLYSSFESEKVAKTGIVPMPKKCDPMIGGHCMVIFDYDENGTIELNSWGPQWGNGGTCHVPWDYVLNEKWCSDFWVLYKSE